MTHKKTEPIHLSYDNVEDELKAKLLLRWHKTLSLSELEEMEKIYLGIKETNKILHALANPQDPIPFEMRESVEIIKKSLAEIKRNPMGEDPIN